ncbi:hypothetical protein MC7420_1409 [Coleofasciculus chthonoplastes PCC 7420]|uniref:Uncharacterized protein n=1 Tax=Coleofasciculus chthonoplastes PCC 7420 TaxID=118168 RepID=B4VR70_9CYAN|nr:hypothetical protein [Coleofasciculus chthonoplastes]EDX75491.1 hypothetical protein MC7420_1409 [Coleofasciculus chthonoplastes PCC 7420]
MKLTRKKKILLLIIASMVAAVGLDMAIARRFESGRVLLISYR